MSQKDVFKKNLQPSFFFSGTFCWFFFFEFYWQLLKSSCWEGCWPTFFIIGPWLDSYLWIKLDFSQPGMEAGRVVVGFRSIYHPSSAIHPRRFHHVHLKGSSDWTWCCRGVLYLVLLSCKELFPVQMPNSLPLFISLPPPPSNLSVYPVFHQSFYFPPSHYLSSVYSCSVKSNFLFSTRERNTGGRRWLGKEHAVKCCQLSKKALV